MMETTTFQHDPSPADYDTDTISVTSTVEDTGEQFFIIDEILADGLTSDGIFRYLTKWEDFALADCTWEPPEHFEGTTVLEDWEKRKREQFSSPEALQEYMENNIAAYEYELAARNVRKAKRAKKRQQNERALERSLFPENDDERAEEPAQVPTVESDSEDDVPLIHQSRKMSAAKGPRAATSPLFEKESKSTRKPPLEQSSESDSQAEESDDSLMNEIRAKGNKGTRKKTTETNLRADGRTRRSPGGTATSSKVKEKTNTAGDQRISALHASRARSYLERNRSASATSAFATRDRQASPQNERSRKPPPARTASGTSARGSTARSKMAPPAKPARSFREGSILVRRSATGTTSGPTIVSRGPIPISTKRVEPVRKEWTKAGNKQYGTLMYRHNAQKLSTRERAPDPNALEFVDFGSTSAGPPKPAVSAPDRQQNRPEPHAEARSRRDDLYGRREFRPRRVSTEEPEENVAATVRAEADKIPETCWEWRNGSCPRSADKCRYLHRDTIPLKLSPFDGSVRQKHRTPPITCNAYMTKPRGCNKSADDCDFAHRNTGFLGQFDGKPPMEIDPNMLPASEGGTLRDAGPPTGPRSRSKKDSLTCFHWMEGRSGCHNSAEECAFAHYNTGLLGRTNGPPVPIDPYRQPEFQEKKYGKERNPNMVPVGPPRLKEQLRQPPALRPEVPPHFQDPLAKIPETCPFWKDGYCRKDEQECLYLHRDTGKVADKPELSKSKRDPPLPPRTEPRNQGKRHPKDLTCWYWYNKGHCRKTEEKCLFKHSYTGEVADRAGGRDRFRNSAGTNSPHHMDAPDDHSFDGGFLGPTDELGSELAKLKSNAEALVGTHSMAFPHPVTHASELFAPQAPMVQAPQTASVQTSLTFHPPPQSLPNPPHQTPPVFQAPPPSRSEFESHAIPRPPPPPSLDTHAASVPIATMRGGTVATHSPVAKTASRISCTDMNKMIEDACKLDFTTIFSANEGGYYLDRRAFLIFNAEEHIEEMELLSRWLLMHHVAVYTLTVDGSWDDFRKEIVNNNGSGVILVHPTFDKYSELYQFGMVLRRKVRIWSVGYQTPAEFDPQFSDTWIPPRYDCIEIFPHGGIIYITDDVFENTPIEALCIIELFIAKVNKCRAIGGFTDPSKYIKDACIPWRLAVRPELLQATYEWCCNHEAAIIAQDPAALARLKLYHVLSESNMIEPDVHPEAEFIAHPDDYWPIISERREVSSEYFEAKQASAGDNNEVNEWQISYFADLVVQLRREYRQFFVVHTEQGEMYMGTQSSQPVDRSKEWMDRWRIIDEVMSPVKCVRYLEGPAKGNRFDFLEWMFAEEKRDGATDGAILKGLEMEVDVDGEGFQSMVDGATDGIAEMVFGGDEERGRENGDGGFGPIAVFASVNSISMVRSGSAESADTNASMDTSAS